MEATMLENGLDFIIDAIRQLKEAERETDELKKRRIKYSLLHLSSGIELILKSRLYKEHWTYVFSDMNKANKGKLQEGDFRSVESAILVERLERLCNVMIDSESKQSFNDLRKRRNQMEHFIIKDTFQAVESCIHNALVGISEFIAENYADFVYKSETMEDDECRYELTPKEDELLEELIKCISELKAHYDEAINIAKAKAEEEVPLEQLIKCPSCKESLLACCYKEENNCHCFFCGYNEKGENAAREYLNNVLGLNEYEIEKDGGEYPLYICPECGVDSFIIIEGQYICFSCGIDGSEEELLRCERCGRMVISDGQDFPVCYDCQEQYMDEND